MSWWKASAPLFFGAILAAGAAVASRPALAEFKVEEPGVEQGELEIEHAGAIERDDRTDHSRAVSVVNELGYGVTEFWATEIEGDWERDSGAGQPLQFNATV